MDRTRCLVEENILEHLQLLLDCIEFILAYLLFLGQVLHLDIPRQQRLFTGCPVYRDDVEAPRALNATTNRATRGLVVLDGCTSEHGIARLERPQYQL